MFTCGHWGKGINLRVFNAGCAAGRAPEKAKAQILSLSSYTHSLTPAENKATQPTPGRARKAGRDHSFSSVGLDLVEIMYM